MLVSLQFKHVVVRLLALLYMIVNVIFAVERAASCMGSIPLSEPSALFEEAVLRWVSTYSMRSFLKTLFVDFRN